MTEELRKLAQNERVVVLSNGELLGLLDSLDAALAEVERLREEWLDAEAEASRLRSRLAEIEKPQAQRLSDAEVDEIIVKMLEGVNGYHTFARAIETAFCSKNGINLGE